MNCCKHTLKNDWIGCFLSVFILFNANKEILAQRRVIEQGAVWPDQNGNHIQAHGGGIIKKEMSLINAPLEGGAVVHYKSLYYVIGSAFINPAYNSIKEDPNLSVYSYIS